MGAGIRRRRVRICPSALTLMRDHNRDEAESMCYRLALAAIGTRHEAAYAKAAEHMTATE